MSTLAERLDIAANLIRETANSVADLERQLAAALKERDNWKQIVQDDCDAENDWRTAAGEWDKSDSYCIESAATVIERMKAELEARKPK